MHGIKLIAKRSSSVAIQHYGRESRGRISKFIQSIGRWAQDCLSVIRWPSNVCDQSQYLLMLGLVWSILHQRIYTITAIYRRSATDLSPHRRTDTHVHRAQSSLVVTHPSTNRGRVESATELALVATASLWFMDSVTIYDDRITIRTQITLAHWNGSIGLRKMNGS